MATTTTFWILELVDQVTGPMKNIRHNTDNAADGMRKLQASNAKAMDAIKSEVPGASSALGLLANPYVAAAAAAVALGAAGVKAVNMANDWREGLAKVNVTAQLTQAELEGLSKQLLRIGMDNVAPIEQIPESFNKIISAGLDVNTSLQVLNPTLRAAKAGFTDVGETAKAAVAVMNSSGRGINDVYDILFATLNKGNAEFADISQYLPKVIPMARNAGLALGETAGAWAYLTAQGQTAERATTLAQNAMKALADPKRIEAFKQMGVNLYDSSGKIKPLVDIVDVLNKKTQGLSDLAKANFYGQIGLDQEAASFFAVASQNAQKFRETVEYTTNSQGALNQAYKDSLTPMDRWRQLSNMVKGYMIELGSKALPIVEMMGEKVFEVVNWFKELYAQSQLVRDIISGIGTAITWFYKIALVPLRGVVNMFKLLVSAVDWLVSKIPGMGGGIEGFYKKVRPYLVYLKEMFGGLANIMYKIMTFDFKGAYDDWKAFKMPSMDEIKVRVAADDSGKATDIKKPSPVLTLNGLKTPNGGGSSSQLTGTGTAQIKSISQKIEIKNYFSIPADMNKADMESVAEKVVRAINDKLRDGMVAAS